MATLNVPYNGVNAPGAASFTPPQINDAAIANLPKAFYEGQQAQHQLAVQNAFQRGLPTTDGTPSGPTDWQAAYRTLMKFGDYDNANKMLQTAIQQQGMQNSIRTNNMLQYGDPNGPSANAAGPRDFYTANRAAEGNVTDPKFSNGTASGVTQITQDTWDDVRKEHPEAQLPPVVTDATADQQQKAEKLILYHNTGVLADSGISVTDRNARITYFFGAHGGVKFLNAFSKSPMAPAAPMFPAEAENNPGVFYNVDPATGKPGPGGGSKTLRDVMLSQTAGFGNGNTTGFNPPVAPRNQVAGPGAPSQFGGPQGQAIDPRTGQPTQPTPIARGTAPAPTIAYRPGVDAFADELTAEAAAHGGTAPGGAAAPTGGAAAANAARFARAAVPSAGANFGALAEPAQGDSSNHRSYAQTLANPPPSNSVDQARGAAPPSSAVLSAPPRGGGPLDPALNSLVPPGLQKLFAARGIPQDQWAGAAVSYLTAAATEYGVSPQNAESYRQLAGEIGQTLRMRSTPNPAIKEIEFEALPGETPEQTVSRMAAAKAAATGTAEATAKANVELQTAGRIAEAKGQGEDLSKLPKNLADSANSAKLSNNMIEEMQAAAPNFRMGWGADTEQHANSIISGMGHILGIDTSGYDKQVGSYQDFIKISGQLVRQATRETSPRAAYQEMEYIRKSMPSPEMAENGFDIIAPQIKALGDIAIAKQQAGAAWAAQHGNSYAGFETDWNKNVSPAAFVFQRMSHENPEALKVTFDNMAKAPGGKAVINHIRAEMDWANAQGLFGG